MKNQYQLWMPMALLFISFQILNAQTTPGDIYRLQTQEAMENGTYPAVECLNAKINNESLQKMMCGVLTSSYGTNSWQPTSGDACNRDASCDVPVVPNASCNGGKYRIPLAITIFECSSWTGENYLNNISAGGSNSSTGFLSLADADLNALLDNVNTLYANANLEFYEVQRVRVENCDLYDFYTPTDPATGDNDGLDDLNQSVAFDLTDVINLYFVGGLQGDHDCCGTQGFAPYPICRDYSIMRYQAGISGTTIAHELGHYFGLYHTHHDLPTNFADVDGYPSGALNNSDCLTTGDGICDTWPDPRFSHNCDHTGATNDRCYVSGCNFDAAGFAAHAHGASTTLSIDPGEGVDCAGQEGVSSILEQNIMSYNSLSGCRTDFSYCQYRKMYDVATDAGCRAYLCHSDVEQYFASTTVGASTSPYQEICVGEAIPTFNAGKSYTNFAGVAYDVDCFDWFLGEDDMKASALLSNASSFTPTAANVDVNTPGTYTFWIAEVNNINDPPCKSQVIIEVKEDPGTASMSLTAGAPGVSTACLSTDVSSLSDTKLVGWWITETAPISTSVTSSAVMTTALAGATIGGSLTNPANHIFESTSGAPLNAVCVPVDCNLFSTSTTLHATPLVACSAPPMAATECSASSSGTPVTVSGNTGSRSGLVDFSTATCPTDHMGVQSWKVTLTLDAYSGGSGTVALNMRGNNSCTNAGFLFSGSLSAPATGSVYNYTTTDFPAGYDPTQAGQEICALIWDTGSSSATLQFTLEVTRCYAATVAIPFPTTTYYSCVFGPSVSIDCSTILPIELISFAGRLENEQVVLNWETWVEINNEYFTIEKSSDGVNYEKIGIVAGNGTSNEKHQYDLIDRNPTAGINYYKLSQTDFDNITKQIGLVTVKVSKGSTIEIVPNPIKQSVLSFNYESESKKELNYEIYDVTGKTIMTGTLGMQEGLNTQAIQLPQLNSGLYILRTQQDQKIFTEKFTLIE